MQIKIDISLNKLHNSHRRRRIRVLDHFGLWWIVLFLYSPVVHTSVTVLHCPYIETLEEYVSLQYPDSVYILLVHE